MKGLVAALVGVALLTGCASVPTGPSVMVLPGDRKSFEQFQFDDGACRHWALRQTGTTTDRVATDSTVSGAVIGTAVGAAAGAAIGAAAGSPGPGAAAGAGVGLLGGTAIGAGRGDLAHASVQRRYDAAYTQCMYAKGHQIPVARGSVPRSSVRSSTTPPPPPAATAPAPPSAAPPGTVATIPPPPSGPPPSPPPAAR